LEKGKWRSSAIERLYPKEFEFRTWQQKTQRVTYSPDSLLQAHIEQIHEHDVTSNAFGANWRNHFDIIFKILLEKEIVAHRQAVSDFFRYVGNSLNTTGLPFLWDRRQWNKNQVGCFYVTCQYYNNLSVILWNCTLDELDDDQKKEIGPGFDMSDMVHTCGRMFRALIYPCDPPDDPIFSNVLAESAAPGFLSRENFGSSKELTNVIEALKDGLCHPNGAIKLGTFLIQQILFVDFFSEVCLPFYVLEKHETKEAQMLPRQILWIKKSILKNSDLLMRCAESPQNFFDALQGGRVLIKAQTQFYLEFYRSLVNLE